MKYLTLLLLLLLLLFPTQSCIHTDPWTTQDKILQAAYLTAHTLDYLQTRNADWDRFYETNPILGRAPSTQSVDIYFLSTALLHPLITHLLPQSWRKYWLGSTLLFETSVVCHNFHIGMGINF